MATTSVEVRTLGGESIVVEVSSDRSIGDLKALLRESFPPAKRSPSFHLFFKGTRLGLHSRIGSCVVQQGEFVVLVPFTKKSQHSPAETGSDLSKDTPSEIAHQRPAFPAADSAWRDIMNDLSSISNLCKSDEKNNPCSSSDNMNERNDESTMNASSSNSTLKRKHRSSNDSILHDLLCFDIDDLLQIECISRIRRIVESVNCLSDDAPGRCLLYEEYFRTTGANEQCVCPSWLRRVLKIFTFVNILYVPFQMQKKWLTWDHIDKSLNDARSFSLDDVSVSDVEKLPLLCPEAVKIFEQEKVLAKSRSTIFIGSSIDHCKPTKRPAKEKFTVFVSSYEKRFIAFKKKLWKSLKCCMEKKLSSGMPLSLPLDDHISMKDITANSEAIKMVTEKKRSLASLCHGVQAMKPDEMVEHLRNGLGKHGQIMHVEEICARKAVYADFPMCLSGALQAALKGIGISRLYNHQAEAIQASLSRKDVVVSTSTSSGKSLCYNLPVLESLSQSSLACALYIFPMKALAQDQLRALLEITKSLGIDLNIGVYDGDTPHDRRAWIRENARLLITNPDMLHVSILPSHRKFERMLSNLRYIVIDEAHAYKGAFGCHTALILRRLHRICSHVYGSTPSFIFCTATSANPSEHAMELGNLLNVELIQKDGSPCGPKYFLLWNPPLSSGTKTSSNRSEEGTVESEILIRRSSPILETSYLLAEMVQHGLRCIAFCKTRKLCELVMYHTREILSETSKDLANSICVYRAGYTPQDRRKIEADLFEKKLCGVVATNALELGIDVGYIDATLHLGFPGSISSLWQQAGRSGRRANPSIAVYVAFEGPLDQYFMKFPHNLFGGPIEHCHVDPHNQKVLQQHVACAAYELPLSLDHDEKYFGTGLGSAVVSLKDKGYLGSFGVSSPKLWTYIGPENSPSYVISIRAIETNKYKVVEKLNNELLEEIEESRAFFQIYEGAVYMHQGSTYLVQDLDISTMVAFCQKADLKYYTKTRDYTDIHVIGGDLAYPSVNSSESGHLRTTAQANACKVTTTWFGFYRVWRATNKIFDAADLNLPTFSYESQAVWIRVPQSIKTNLEAQNLPFRAGLHAASHALLNVVPLYVMCSTSDLGTECANPHETRPFLERILLYDQHPGGIGITLQVQILFGELLTAAYELVSKCSCLSTAGCPNCIQIFSCREYNEVLNKKAAIAILEAILEAEMLNSH